MILDIIALILVIYGFAKGYKRGLINTLFDTLSLIIGVVAALKLSPIIIGLLGGILPFSPSVVFIIGVVVTFILVMLIIRFIGDKLEDVVDTVKLGSINKIAGGALMALVIAIVISFIYYFGIKTQLISEKQKTESMTYPYLEPLPSKATATFDNLKPAFRSFWDKMIETFDSIKEQAE